MSQTLVSTSRTVTLPDYKPDGFKEQLGQNIGKNYALTGRLWVDFLNVRKGWTIEFDILTIAQWNSLKTIFNDQLANEEFLQFNDTDLGISAVLVFLNLPSERNIKWNKSVCNDVAITLEVRDADSQL
jgi:hypothetical protein